MIYFLLLIAWISGLVGFVIGSCWHARCEVQRAQNRRLKLILLGVSASVAAGRGVIQPKEPEELLRIVDIQPTRVN